MLSTRWPNASSAPASVAPVGASDPQHGLRARHVLDVVAAARSRHGVLLHPPIRLPDAVAVCESEGVALVICPFPKDGLLVAYAGEYTIMAGTHLPAARLVPVVLHELAHRWLHAPAQLRPQEAAFATEPVEVDREEVECDLAVASLLLGANDPHLARFGRLLVAGRMAEVEARERARLRASRHRYPMVRMKPSTRAMSTPFASTMQPSRS